MISTIVTHASWSGDMCSGQQDCSPASMPAVGSSMISSSALVASARAIITRRC